MKDQRLFWVWCDMRRRCTSPKHRAFKNYGGRGIAFCPAWRSFAQFCADMGPRPAGGMLDRKDNNGNYEPGNCRWATRKEQNSNRRNCLYVYDGAEKVTLKEYCRRHSLAYRAVRKRMRRGWTLQYAINLPLGTWLNETTKRRMANGEAWQGDSLPS